MAEKTKKAAGPVFAGPFGYRANGLDVEQVALLANGAIHRVEYDRSARTVPGALVDNFVPEKERLYTYSQVRRACQKARTEIRLYGTMSLVGPEGGMTRFGIELGRMEPVSTHEWIEKLTFPELRDQKEAIEAAMITLYAEVNAD